MSNLQIIKTATTQDTESLQGRIGSLEQAVSSFSEQVPDLTQYVVRHELANVAFSGKYADLLSKPSEGGSTASLTGNIYDCSTDEGRRQALEDIVRVLGGAVEGDVPDEGEPIPEEDPETPKDITKSYVYFDNSPYPTSWNWTGDITLQTMKDSGLYEDDVGWVLHPVRVELGTSVTSMRGNVFWNCRTLKSISIPDLVTSIGGFPCCSNLQSIHIPSPVTEIDRLCFVGCDALTSITLSSNISRIGQQAFSFCRGLETFYVSDDNANYTAINKLLLSKDRTTVIAGVNGTVIIPNTVNFIGEYAFDGLRNLESVEIPLGVENIGPEAFSCTGLASIFIPDSVLGIGDGAFRGCVDLMSIQLGRNLISVGDNAFAVCSRVQVITIPASVSYIGNNAFHMCDSLTNLIFEGKSMAQVEQMNPGPSDWGLPNTTTISVTA